MTTNPKDTLILALKIVALTLVLLVLSAIGSTLLPSALANPGTAEAAADEAMPAPSGSGLRLIVLVMAAQVVALALPILLSRWHGWRLTAALFVVHFGTVTFLNQIESLIYLDDKMPEGLLGGLFAMGLFTSALFAPIAVLVLGRWRPSPSASPDLTDGSGTALGAGAWRVPVAGAVFVSLYYLFGYYVAWRSPEVRAYYGGTDPGSFLAQMSGIVRSTPWMLPLQFLRALGWVGLGWLILHSMRGPWWHRGLATALLFSVPCLYLLFPNPIMPELVARAHLVETLPYQFLFGLFLGWFLRPRDRAATQANPPA